MAKKKMVCVCGGVYLLLLSPEVFTALLPKYLKLYAGRHPLMIANCSGDVILENKGLRL